MKKYSRQRAAIIEALKSTDCHPTAAWVHEEVKKSIPNISLATVYRNIAALVKSGDIITVPVAGRNEHFDADISEHYHFCCNLCGSVLDVPAAADLKIDIEPLLDCKVSSSSLVFYGICKRCLEK